MSIKLKGSTDGSVTLQAPADTSPTGTDKTFTLPTQDGDSGQILKTNGSGALSFTDNLASNRNLIINGAMLVAQRGTSTTGVASSGYYSVDRMSMGISSLGTYTVTQESDGPAGFSKSYKIDCTTADSSPAAGDFIKVDVNIEAQNLQHLDYGASTAKALTFTFYVKSNKTGNASFEVQQKDNSDRQITPQYTINAANTWEKKTISIPADTAGLINDDNGTGLRLSWWLNSGSNYSGGSHRTTWTAEVNADRNVSNLGIGGSTSDYWQITGLQLEIGDVATPFEHRSYGDELARCQRYCFKYAPSNQEWIYNESNGANQKWWHFYYPAMRDTPSFDAGTLSTGTGTSVNGLSGTINSLAAGGSFGSGASGRQSIRVTMSATGGTEYNIHHTDSWAGDHCFCFSEL